MVAINGMEKKLNDCSVSHIKWCILYKEDKRVELQAKVNKLEMANKTLKDKIQDL